MPIKTIHANGTTVKYFVNDKTPEEIVIAEQADRRKYMREYMRNYRAWKKANEKRD
jgi:hypothetical protein